MPKGSKKILMVIASKGFRDEEYFVPREVMENAGFKVEVASDKPGVALGDDGGEVKVDLTLDKVRAEDFNAVAFIGGPGALKHLDNKESYQVARKFFNQKKPTAAICISPVILAKAGLLEGKRATVWTSSLDKSGKKKIESKGAKFLDKNVVQDGNIITACGPKAAKEFGEAIVRALE